MGAQDFKLSALRNSQPLNALLELTYACNWRCVFCFNPRHHDIRRLSGDEWIAVLDDLRALGTMNLTLSGGEPLANPDFLRIARAARERYFTLRVFTNGSLIDESLAQEIAGLYPSAVEVSIHGADAETHESTTARAGSFAAVIRAIELLKAEGVNVVAKAPITRLNEHQIDAIVDLAARLDVSLQIDPTITANDNGDLASLSYSASPSGLRRAIEIGIETGSVQKRERSAGAVNCGVGRLSMAIDPEGNVFPCHQWRHSSLGNVREHSLRELWLNSGVRREAAAVADEANQRLMAADPRLSQYSFCPALAAQNAGDPLAFDREFVTKAEVAAELWDKARSEELK
jgi:MoaA/NifB/PqqE/SkfB family radical SAM enzyme